MLLSEATNKFGVSAISTNATDIILNNINSLAKAFPAELNNTTNNANERVIIAVGVAAVTSAIANFPKCADIAPKGWYIASNLSINCVNCCANMIDAAPASKNTCGNRRQIISIPDIRAFNNVA